MWNILLPTVLHMSFTGSIAILVVLLGRILLHRMPKIFSYLLWSVVLLRLLCPISFHTHLSVMKFVDVQEKTGGQSRNGTQDLTYHQNVPLQVSDIKPNGLVQKSATDRQPGTDDLTETFLYWGTVIWIAGAAIIFIYNIVSLVRFRRKLVGAVRLRDNIYLSDYIPSAFVFGVLRPRIYLPVMLSDQEQEYIIMHEQVHIRRKDHLIKVLALIALGIHWFNPFVWLACRSADKDMEMSCDEAVMRKINRDIRAEYSTSLLKLATGRRILPGTFPAFRAGETEDRIKHILRYKKPTIAAILAAVTIMGITVVFAGSEPKEQGSEKPDRISQSVNALKDDILDKNIPDGEASDGDSSDKNPPVENDPVQDEAGENKYANSVSAVVPEPGETWEHSVDVNEDYVHTMECAFLRLMTEDTIEADPVEFIDEDTDPKRRKELGITMEYLRRMDGYELNNPDKDTLTWKIDDNTEFIFLDWGHDFIKEMKPCKSITIKTKDRELFRSYLATYKNSKPGMPFFFEVENGVVKRIVERFFA